MADYKLGVDVVVNNQSGRKIAEEIGKALNDAAKSWKDQVAENFSRGVEAGLRLSISSGKAGAAIKKFAETNLTDVYEKFNKAVSDGNAKEAAKLERLLDKRTRQFEREVQAQADAYEAMQKRSAQTWSQSADKFRDTVDDINRSMHMKDPSGYLGMGRQLGGRIAERGRARQQQAFRMRDAGVIDDAAAAKMASRGAMVAKIGVALGAIAAVAAAVLALIKLFMDLNDRIVDMNKAILKTGTISDMGIGGRAFEAAHKFNRELETMRTDVLAASSELDGFRVSSEEMFGTLGALNEYGKGFEKIADQIDRGATHLRNYGDAAELAITYAKLMGTSSEEMGQNMSRIANDMGQDFERVAEGLSAVRQEALLSGFSMKRFVSTIMEATTGMGAYAVRLEEAGKTLKFLSNAMGETAAKELFGALVNRFTELGTGDRLKRILTTGLEPMADIFESQAKANADSIAKDLEAVGYEALGTTGAGLVANLRKMSEDERLEMLADLKQANVSPELAQRLDNLVETVRAGQGDLGAMVNAMSDMGPAGTLAALTQNQVFGGMRLHEFQAQGAAQRAAAEQMTGMTGKQFEILVDASRATSADMRRLLKIQAEVRDGRKLSRKEQEEFAQKFGATVTGTGEIVSASYDLTSGLMELGGKIEDENDLMLAQNERYKKAEEAAVSEDIELARRVAQSTEKLSNVMEANMLQVLNQIYKAIYDFYMDFMSIFGKDDQGRVGAQNRFARLQQEANDAMIRNSQAMTDLEKQIEATEDPVQKQKLEAKLKARADAQAALERQREIANLAEQAVRQMDTKGMSQAEIQQAVAKDLKEKGYELSPQDLANLNEAYTKSGDLKGGNIENAQKLGGVLGGLMSPGGRILGSVIGGRLASAEQRRYLDMADKEGSTAAAEALMADLRKSAGLGEASSEQRAAVLGQLGAGLVGGRSFKEQMPELIDLMLQQMQSETRTSGTGNILKDLDTTLGSIEENTAKSAEADRNLETGLKADLVKDMILPAGGGRPIITDPQDTLMAFKPGGPISQAMGGGGGAPVTVNIYGGDPQKVYEQVMRVMKTLGHA